MSNLTYYCTCCGTDEVPELRSIEDIGFSLDESFCAALFDHVGQYVEKIEKKDISKEFNQILTDFPGDPLFSYLSHEDIGDLFRNKPTHVQDYEGDMVITYDWMKKKSRRVWAYRRKANQTFLPFPEDVFPGHDEEIYRGRYRLHYHDVEGILVPQDLEFVCNYKDNQPQVSGTLRRCACGRPLSRYTGTGKEIVIALQGSSRAGKTTAMISSEYLLSEQNIQRDSPISIESYIESPDPNDAPLVWVSQQHERYKMGQTVDKTQKITETKHLIYSFRLKVNGKDHVLTMVDMAGEIFDEEARQLNQRLISEYRNVYKICNAVWTFVPYQTLLKKDEKFDWPFLMRHRTYYIAQGDKAAKVYQTELETWKEVVTKGKGTYPSYQEFLKEIPPENPGDALLNKYICVHEARLLQELGETEEVLRNATGELFKNRLEKLTRFWDSDKRPPHAVILTKSDSIASLFLNSDEERQATDWYIYEDRNIRPSDSVLNYPRDDSKSHSFRLDGADHILIRTGPNEVAVDEEVLNRICRNVRKFCTMRNEHFRQNFAALNREQTCEFAQSAYGGRPINPKYTQEKAGLRYCPPKPYNVLVPLLWTMVAANVLPVSYIQTDIRDRTPEEVKKLGTGRVVTERRVTRYLSEDALIAKNLYCTGDTYHYHERSSSK